MRFFVVVFLLLYTPFVASDRSTEQCLQCPPDINVGVQKSCDLKGRSDGTKWKTGGWSEMPVIDWTCDDSRGCDIGDCVHCGSFVEIGLIIGCRPDLGRGYRPGFGFPMEYADPLQDPSLLHYLENPKPTIVN